MKWRRMIRAGHLARMGERRNAYRMLVGKVRGKDAVRPFNDFHDPTGMSTGKIKKIMFLGSKGRPVLGADNLIAIYEPII
jgi:hypothetical protein